MDMQLKGRTALISGASSGIGAGVAQVLAQEGVRIAITARRTELLAQQATLIASATGQMPVVISADITDAGDIARIVHEAKAALGHIDILVNCAGGSRLVTATSPDQDWDDAFTLSFAAARRLTHAVLPDMQAQQWGRIINISGSMEPRAINAASAAKAALHIWAKGLSCDVAAQGITVNCIPPGRINSEQVRNKLHPTEESRRTFIQHNIPAGYFGEPEDIAHLVAFLSSQQARYITGAVIPVDGGMHYFAH